MIHWWLINITQAAYKNPTVLMSRSKNSQKNLPPTSACMSIRSWGCLRKGTLEVSWYASVFRHRGTRWWGHGCGTNHSFSVGSHIVVDRCGVVLQNDASFYIWLYPVSNTWWNFFNELMKWMPLNTLADKFRHSQGHRRWNWVHRGKRSNAKVAIFIHFPRLWRCMSQAKQIKTVNQWTLDIWQPWQVGHGT